MPTLSSPEHLRFAVLAADTALFTLHDGTLLVRLITVHRPPYFSNSLGLPGGLLEPTETAEAAAHRHLTTKTGVSSGQIYLEQLYTFSAVDRDPRGRVVAVTYLALVPWEALLETEREPYSSSYWAPVEGLTGLAYDHDEVLKTAVLRLRDRSSYTTLLQKLLPQSFTLSELENAYRAVVNQPVDRRNFRKKILKLGILTELDSKRTGMRSRPAALFRFSSPDIVAIDPL